MSSIKINTDLVIDCADKLKSYNRANRDRFDDVQSKVNTLDKNWDGAAATGAMQKFNAIRSSFCEARYDIVDDYACFLIQLVAGGYHEVETANTTLADQFK